MYNGSNDLEEGSYVHLEKRTWKIFTKAKDLDRKQNLLLRK